MLEQFMHALDKAFDERIINRELMPQRPPKLKP